MSFTINENSLRGGNRGGKDRFDWEEVKIHNWKDRSCYLGISEKLGSLEKHSKWIKNDWYLNKKNTYKHEILGSEKEKLKEEFRRVKEEEADIMNQMLGLKPKEAIAKIKNKELSIFEKKKLFSKESNIDDDKDCESRINFDKYKQSRADKKIHSVDLKLKESEDSSNENNSNNINEKNISKSEFYNGKIQDIYKIKGSNNEKSNLDYYEENKKENSSKYTKEKYFVTKKTDLLEKNKKKRSEEEELINSFLNKYQK
jgi:hypothetical protein